ncbi:hypothetical protein RND81_11G183500 [Saponaria officinalis]|uniref:MLO-like protein n=1 Tax=Saponaria officinalis TaxID=3572 RepID=A0AAW1HQC5_SAPOF
MGERDSNSLEFTSTWIVAVVCFIIVVISLAAERGLHRLGKCLVRNDQQSLYEALQKIKAELMLLGFISLLLTVFQGMISNICIPTHLTHFMLPCKRETAAHESDVSTHFAAHPSWNKRRLLSEGGDSHQCTKKGMAQFMSLEALHQLHILIFVLAVVFVVFNATTMILGGVKVRRWKHWEESLRREILKTKNGDQQSRRVSQIHARHRHEFFKQHRGHSAVVGVLVSFFKQFYGSVTKSDYIALRHGFIMTHCPGNQGFDFHKYMLRTLEYEFKKVAGISWWLWMFVVVFLLVNLEGAHVYFWLSFLPLILLLLVGTKLEHIIMSLAEEIKEKDKGNKELQIIQEVESDKTPWVKPSDKHFWFERPSIVLYLIHFILFQNSFEIAFFFWVLITYGIHSCILDRVGFIIPRLIIGLIVQVLCSYSTLPLYTIVTQMGSRFKPSILGPLVHETVGSWLEDVRERSSGHGKGVFGSSRIEIRNLSSELREIIPVTDQTAICFDGSQTR